MGAAVGKGNAVAAVETVRGPVDLGDLGQTLMHEHVFVMENPVRYFTPARDGAS
jgi:phosphotriesterase-related protein